MFRTSFIFGLLISVALELTYRYHGRWAIFVGIIIALLLYVRWWFGSRIEDESRNIIPLFSFVSLSLIFSVLFATVIDYSWLRHLFALGVGLYFAFIADELSGLRGDIRSRPQFYVTTITILTAVTLFFGVGFVGGMRQQLESVSLLFPLFESVAYIGIVFLAFKVMRIPTSSLIMVGVVGALIILEGQWVLSFLPLGAVTRSLLLCIPLVLWLFIERDRLLYSIEPKKIAQWGGAALTFIFLILFTTRWS